MWCYSICKTSLVTALPVSLRAAGSHCISPSSPVSRRRADVTYTASWLDVGHASLAPANLWTGLLAPGRHRGSATGSAGAGAGPMDRARGGGLAGISDQASRGGLPGLTNSGGSTGGLSTARSALLWSLYQRVKSTGTGFSFPPKLDKLESNELVRGKIKSSARLSNKTKPNPFLWLLVWKHYRYHTPCYLDTSGGPGVAKNQKLGTSTRHIPQERALPYPRFFWITCLSALAERQKLPPPELRKKRQWVKNKFYSFFCSLFYLSPGSVQQNQFFCISALTPADVGRGHHSCRAALTSPWKAATVCSEKLSDTEALIQALPPVSHCSKYKLYLMQQSVVELAYDLHANGVL